MFVTSLLNLPGSYKIYNSFSIKKTIQLIPPLNANPRRIDVGEGQNSNFAKVRDTLDCCFHYLVQLLPITSTISS